MPAAITPEFGGTSVRVGRPVAVKRRVGSFMAMKVPVCVMAVVESLCPALFTPNVLIMEVVVGVLGAVL